MQRYLYFMLVILWNLTVNAQEFTVSGTVTEEGTEDPLPGVNIIEKGTNNGTTSDQAGDFELEVSDDSATLEVSFVGYKDRTVPLNGRRELPITLKPASQYLDEVVVTALGIERDKRSLGYAVDKLDAKEMTEVREPNLVNSLAGRTSGVQTTSGASGPGSSSRLVIRGETSLSGNNQPLFVIDGVPIRNQTVKNNTVNDETGFQEVDYGNGAAEISPNDIASLSVLKGAGAAALYGGRAANGVVLIETKDGSGSEGLGVSFQSSVTLKTPLTMPQFQNTYGQGSGGQFAYEDGEGGGVNDGGITSFGPKMKGQPIPQFTGPSQTPNGTPVRGGDVIARSGEPIEPTPWESSPDNVRNFFNTGVTEMTNLALSGGNGTESFRVSYTNTHEEGMIPNTDLKRHNVAVSGQTEPAEALSVRSYINYIRSSSSHRPAIGYGSENPMYLFTWMGRQVDVEALKDYWQHGQEGFQQFNYNYKWMDNPYLATFENTNGFNKDRLLGNINVEYAFSDSLSLRLLTGMDQYHDLRRSKRAFSSQRFPDGAYREDEVEFREVNTDLRFTYERGLADHLNGSFSLGGKLMDRSTAYTSTTAGKLSVPGIYNFENASVPLTSSQEFAGKRIWSAYAIGRFNHKGRIYLELTYRSDRSSTLPLDNNLFHYYSGSLGIVLSDMLTLPSWVSYAKLRLSGSSVGNDTDPFQLRNTFEFNENYGSAPLLTHSSTLQNPGLKPERVNTVEAGAELWFLEDHVGLDLSLYQNSSRDQIIQIPTSSASGFSRRLINGGRIRSRGVEASLDITPVQGKKFQWTSTLNFSRNIARVTDLPEGVDRFVTGHSSIYDSEENTVFYIAHEGGRMGAMYGTGFRKKNGEIVYDNNGLPVRDPELRLLGNYNPDFMMGWSNRFQYRNFALNFLWDLRKGGTVVSRMLSIGSTSGVLKHTLEGRENGIVGDGVTSSGEANSTSVPAQTFYNQFYNRANEESALYSATYLKLRAVKLGYDLSGQWMSKVGLRSFNVSLIGRNLLLFTENPHFDPELTTMQGRDVAKGVEDMAYPSARSFGMRIKAKF